MYPGGPLVPTLPDSLHIFYMAGAEVAQGTMEKKINLSRDEDVGWDEAILSDAQKKLYPHTYRVILYRWPVYVTKRLSYSWRVSSFQNFLMHDLFIFCEK